MDWKSATLAAAVAFLFVLQGIACWRRSGRSGYGRPLGVLTVLFAGLGFSSHFLLASGALIFSREFGVVIVQGTAAGAALMALLVGLPVCAAVGIHVGRSLTGMPPHWLWRPAIGAGIGVAAISRVEPLGTDAGLAPSIRAYDFWWPLLPLWVGLCVLEGLLAIGRVRQRSLKVCLEAAFAVGLSFWPIWREGQGLHHADPQSLALWRATLCLGLPVLMGTTVWHFQPAWPQRWRTALCACWVAVTGLAGAAGLANSLVWLGGTPLPVVLRPWFLWMVWVGVAFALAGVAIWRRWKAGALHVPDFGSPGRWDDLVGGAALLAIGVGLVDALYLRSASDVLDLILVLIGWGTFVEVIAVGPLYAFFGRPLLDSLRSVEAQILGAGRRLSLVLVRSSKAIASGVKWFFNFGSAGVGAVRLLLLAVLLVALAELPDAGKTVVVPFRTLGLSEEESKDFGRMISHRVVNAFGTLARELQPEVAILLPSGPAKTRFGVVALGDAGDRPEASVGSGDVEVGGVKVPVTLLTGWIQAPMRALLGVRVVTGSVQKDGDGYVLLAHSSDGGIWRVRYPPEQRPEVPESTRRPPEVSRETQDTRGGVAGGGRDATSNSVLGKPDAPARPPAPRSTPNSPQVGRAQPPDAGEQPRAGPDALAPKGTDTTDRTIAAAGLAGELAYKLISTLPAMAQAGMTQSSQAAQPFSRGLQAWSRHSLARPDYEALGEASRAFQEAVRLDPGFALAHYRLGLALQADGQPSEAAEAFRQSLRANPDFALGYNALASHLYFYQRQYYPSAAGPSGEGSRDTLDAYNTEARKLWHQVLRFRPDQVPLLDRAAAYFGLCRMIVDSKPAAGSTPGTWMYAPQYLAYFYCHRALRLYTAPPATARFAPEVRAAEGSAWNTTGVILSRSGRESYRLEKSDGDWQCSEFSVDPEDVKKNGKVTSWVLHRSPYTRDALRYYQHASSLMTEDAIVQCNAATAAHALGERRPMRELEASSAAHLSLADALVGRVQDEWEHDKACYRVALAEFEQAFRLDPQNLVARNNYSYAVWRWHLGKVSQSSTSGPPRHIVQAAEGQAREAARRVAGKGTRADEANMRATLGEVLLMQGRAHEAYPELEQATKLAPEHPFFDEGRWDLALAYLCASAADRNSRPPTRSEKEFEREASALLEKIRRREEGREHRPYTERRFQEADLASLCVPDPGAAPADESVDLNPTRYELQDGARRTDRYSRCDQLAIIAYVAGTDPEDSARLGLRVWGPGINVSRPIFSESDTHPDKASLPLPREDTHHQYFAQLERVDVNPEVPLSRTYSLQTRADVGCSNNRIVLFFRPVDGPARVPGS